ncbi:MAG: hypothetical protein ACFN40_07745, partial [Bacteroidota bacterium]
MRKAFFMVAAAAAMLATGFTACKSHSPGQPKEVDVYVAGYAKSGVKDVAKVWKNGKELYELTDGSKDAGAFSVFVVGGDVYTVGYELGSEYVAKMWKNKSATDLTDGSKGAYALSVFVAGS